jgi:hypothetical protein
MAMLLVASGSPTQQGAQLPPTQHQVAAAEQNAGARPLTIPTEGLPPAYQGMPFHSSVMATGGVGPYTMTLSGDLPPGVTYDPGFNVITLNGVPTSTGTFSAEITATDAYGARVTQSYTLDVRPVANITPSPAIVTLPEAMHINDATNVFFPAVIKIPEVFHITDGMMDFGSAREALPEAFHINDKTTVILGVQYGLPEAFHINDKTTVILGVQYKLPEAFHINDKTTVLLGAQYTLPEAFHITDKIAIKTTVGILPTTAPAATYNVAYSQTFNVAGNTGAATLTPSGALPTGMSFITGGGNVTLSGTPTQVGSFPFTLTATDTVSTATVNYTLVVSGGTAQTITVGTLPTPTYGGAPFNVSATSDSGLPVTITYLSGPVTGSGSGPYTITGTGPVYFQATQTGDTTYAAATPVNFSVNIAAANQTITLGALPTPTYGGAPFNLSATSDSGLPVTITLVSGPVNGSGNGPYAAISAGTANFQATQAGNSNYNAATPVNFSVTIAAATQTITLGALPMPTYGGAPFSLSATSDSSLPVTITYVSGPVTGSGNGPYTITGGGTANFQATQSGNASYSAATPVNFSVTIAPAAQNITVGTLPTPTYGGAPFSVSATSDSGLPVTISYVSGPASGAGSGPYTATGSGTVNFTATQTGNANYAAATPVNFSVNVSAASQIITVGTLPTPVYGDAPFSVSASSNSGLPVTISYVGGPATGSGNGPYTISGAGTVNFQATQAGNTNYSAATPVNFSVTIAQAPQIITVGALPTPTFGGAPFNVSATSNSGLPVTITYVSGPASGSGSGPYTATGTGMVNFQATQAGSANYLTAPPVNFSVNVTPSTQNITVGTLPTPTYLGAPFSVSATSDSGLPVTITYVSGPATGIGSGPYTATGGGQVNFQATQTGNANYSAATPVNFSVTIAPAVPTLAFAAIPAHNYGDAPFLATASSASNGAVSYSLGSGPGNINATTGLVSLSGAGTLTLNATQVATTNYTSASTQTILSIGKQGSVTAVSVNPTTVTPLQIVTLTAAVSPSVTGTPSGTVTFFDNTVQVGLPVTVVNGQAQISTLLLSGPQSITATYSGDGNFLGSSSTATPSTIVSVAPLDFTLIPLTSLTFSVVPGTTGSFSFNITPLYNIYPGPVSFTLTGLPTGATYTFTPSSIAANGGPQNVTVTIFIPAAVVRNSSPSRPGTAPLALAVLLPLLALSGLRHRRRWLGTLLLVVSIFAVGALSGCGSGTVGNGFFGQAPKTYPVVVTINSGGVQHTLNVSLQVQ